MCDILLKCACLFKIGEGGRAGVGVNLEEAGKGACMLYSCTGESRSNFA
jgi:hypothetical protein